MGNTTPGAMLVGSNTVAGTHALAIDLDLPAVLVETPDGVDLWVDAPCGFRAWRTLLDVATAVGVARPRGRTWRSTRKLSRRQAAYAEHRGAVLDDSARMETLRVLGPDLTTCTFDAVMATATELAGRPRPGPGQVLRNPWRIPLAVEAILVPSTHNVHLYLECELSWAAYERLLHAMVTARLVQPGCLGASARRRGTYLPWVRKDPDGKLRPPAPATAPF